MTRQVDPALVIRRRTTGEVLLAAGGRWDRIERRFLERPPEHAKIVDVDDSQVEFVRWFAAYIRDLREGGPRDISLVLATSEDVRAMRSTVLLCTLALLIDVPAVDNASTVGWVLSGNAQDRAEIDGAIREYIPASWSTRSERPSFVYTFVHGATLRNVILDGAEMLEQDRVDVVLFDEAHKLHFTSFTDGVSCIRRRDGLTLLAENFEHEEDKGSWVADLKDRIDAKNCAGATYFEFAELDCDRT